MSRIQTGDWLTDLQDNIKHSIEDKPFDDLGDLVGAIQSDLRSTLGDVSDDELSRLQNRMRESSSDLQAFNDQLFKDAPTDVSRLRRYNQVRRQNNLEEVGLLPPEETAGQALEQVQEDIGSFRALPFVGGVLQAKDLFEVLEASEHAEAGTATIDEWELLAEFQEDMAQQARGSTIGADIVGGVAESAAFAVEFAGSGGIIALGKKAVLKGGKKAVKKGVAAAIKRIISKAATGAALRTPFFAPRIAANTVERMVPGFRAGEGDVEPFRIVIGRRGESLSKALANAGLDTVIELFSEGTGEIVAVVAKPLKRVAGEVVDKKIANFRMPAKEFLAKFGYSTFPGELGEERLGATLRTAATELSKLSGFDVINLPDNIIPTAREFGTEAAVLGVLGGGGSALGAALQPKAPGPLDTPEAVQSFATDNPEAAKAIVDAAEGLASGTPNAQTFEQAGIPGTTRSKRKRISEILKGLMPEAAATVEDAPVAQPPPTAETTSPQVQQTQEEVPKAAGTTQESLNGLKVLLERRAAGENVDEEIQNYSKGQKSRKEFLDSLDDFGKVTQLTLFINPLDKDILKALARSTGLAIKAGIHSFEDFIRHLVGQIGYDRVQRLGSAIQQEWEKQREGNLAVRASLPVDDVLAGIVELSTTPTPSHTVEGQAPTPPPSDPIDDATSTMEPGDRLPEIIDNWHANRDESHTVVNLDARKREAEMVELSGAKRASSKAHQDLSLGIHLHIDLLNAQERGLGTPAEQFEAFKKELTPEQVEAYERSQSLSEAEQAMAQRFIEENNQMGIDAQEASVISNHYENYTARLLNPPADKAKAGRTLVGKFTLKSPRAKKRTLDSILHAWSLDYTLRVPDVTAAQRVARESIAQVIHDRNMLAAALKAQIFSTKQIDDTWVRVEHPNMKAWRMVGLADVIDKDAPLETGAWVALPDRGVIGEVRLVSESSNVVLVRVPGESDLVSYKESDLRRRVVKNFGGKNSFLSPEGQLFERQEVYAPEKTARHLNNALGRSPLNDIALAKGLSQWNDILKHTLLTTSLFHHQAFLRSYLLAGRVSVRSAIAEIMRGIYGALKYLIRGNPFLFPARMINPFGLARGFTRQLSGFRAGQAAMDGFTPQLRELVRAGLTIGRQQEWDAAALERKTAIGKLIDRVPGARDVKDKLLQLRDIETDFLFSELGPALKVWTALIEYVDLLARNDEALRKGDVTREELASIAANLANDDFGGLHLQRKGRSPLAQQIARFFLLAPDWTESNIASMLKAFKGGRDGEVYRAMWGRVAIKGVLTTFLSTFILATIPQGGDDRRSVIQRFLDSFKRAWAEGNLRWLEIDITSPYQALGGSKEKRKYFSLIGHFRDVIKFMRHPIKSAKHKGSVLSRMVFSALTGEDWAGRRFTSLAELVGVDDKGQYKTKTSTHDIGDPKGGKLEGRLVAKQIGGRPLDIMQLPSFVAHEARGTAPIQAQQAMGFLAGEIDAFDAITKGIGMMTATTHPPTDPKKSIAQAAKFGDTVQARAALERLGKEQGANEARKFVGSLIDKATRPPTKTTRRDPEALDALKALNLDQKQLMGDFRFYWLMRKRKVGNAKFYTRLLTLRSLMAEAKIE